MKPKVEPDPRSGGNMAYDAPSGLHVMFGSQFDNDPATWTYDLRKNEWQRHKPAISPPTDRNDPVLACDSNVGQVIALVRAVDKSEGKEVDALGQEGIPSVLAWSNRQFRKEYGTFTTEWHQ